jgi:hypothetical protein
MAVSGLALLAGCSSGTGYPAQPSLSAGPSSSATPLAEQPAVRILAEADAAVQASGSVHITAHNAEGSRAVTYADDFSATAGREAVTTSGGGRATTLLIAGVGYIQGNVAALENYFGFPASVASHLSGRWISYHDGDPGYQTVASGMTLSGVVDEISLLAPLTRRSPRLVAGQLAVGVHGTAPAAAGGPAGAKATLYIASTGRPLPLSLQGEIPGEQSNATFSNWGEAVHLTPPPDAIRISSIAS